MKCDLQKKPISVKKHLKKRPPDSGVVHHSLGSSSVSLKYDKRGVCLLK